VLDVEAGDLDALAAANEWLVSDLAQPWLRDTGSPPRWLRLALTPQVIEPVPYPASLRVTDPVTVLVGQLPRNLP